MKAASLLILILLILGFSVSVSAEKFYSVHLTNTDKGLAYSGTTIVNGITPSLEEGVYTATVVGFFGESLFAQQFNPPQGTFDLKLTYFPNGKEVRIEKDGSLFSFPVSQFADTCGNKLCEPQENNLLCPDDCLSKSENNVSVSNNYPPVKSEVKPEVNPEENPENNIEETPLKEPILEKIFLKDSILSSEQPLSAVGYISIILLILFLLLLLFLIWRDRHRHHQKIIAQLQTYISTYTKQSYLPEQIRQGLINNGYRKKDIDAAFSAMIKT